MRNALDMAADQAAAIININKNETTETRTTACDHCGGKVISVFEKHDGRHKVSKSYIEIAGFVRDWVADPASGWREYTYISPPDKRPMAFCTDDGATCFMDYVQMKRDAQRVRREQELRDGATAEWQERNVPHRGAPPPYPPPTGSH